MLQTLKIMSLGITLSLIAAQKEAVRFATNLKEVATLEHRRLNINPDAFLIRPARSHWNLLCENDELIFSTVANTEVQLGLSGNEWMDNRLFKDSLDSSPEKRANRLGVFTTDKRVNLDAAKELQLFITQSMFYILTQAPVVRLVSEVPTSQLAEIEIRFDEKMQYKGELIMNVDFTHGRIVGLPEFSTGRAATIRGAVAVIFHKRKSALRQ